MRTLRVWWVLGAPRGPWLDSAAAGSPVPGSAPPLYIPGVG